MSDAFFSSFFLHKEIADFCLQMAIANLLMADLMPNRKHSLKNARK